MTFIKGEKCELRVLERRWRKLKPVGDDATQEKLIARERAALKREEKRLRKKLRRKFKKATLLRAYDKLQRVPMLTLEEAYILAKAE